MNKARLASTRPKNLLQQVRLEGPDAILEHLGEGERLHRVRGAFPHGLSRSLSFPPVRAAKDLLMISVGQAGQIESKN